MKYKTILISGNFKDFIFSITNEKGRMTPLSSDELILTEHNLLKLGYSQIINDKNENGNFLKLYQKKEY